MFLSWDTGRIERTSSRTYYKQEKAEAELRKAHGHGATISEWLFEKEVKILHASEAENLLEHAPVQQEEQVITEEELDADTDGEFLVNNSPLARLRGLGQV